MFKSFQSSTLAVERQSRILFRLILVTFIITACLYAGIYMSHGFQTKVLSSTLFSLLIASQGIALYLLNRKLYASATLLFSSAFGFCALTAAIFVGNVLVILPFLHLLGVIPILLIFGEKQGILYLRVILLGHFLIVALRAFEVLPHPKTVLSFNILPPILFALSLIFFAFVFLVIQALTKVAFQATRNERKLGDAIGRLRKQSTHRKEIFSQLIEKEKELGNLFETAAIGWMSRNVQTDRIKVNQAFCDMLGYDKETLSNLKLKDFMIGNINSWRDSGASVYDAERQYIHADGSLIDVLKRVIVERDKEGRPLRIHSQSIDITQRKRAETELEREKLLLEEAVDYTNLLEDRARHKDAFFATVSHELRTPLHTIISRSQALNMGIYGQLTTKQTDTVKGIETSGGHLLALINDVLDIAKITAGEMRITCAQVNVRELIEATIAEICPLAEQKSIEIEQLVVMETTHIVADEGRLRQILINLLSNALKFTPEGKKVGLMVTEQVAQNLIHLMVWDEGVGISEDKQRGLFEPFIQVENELSSQSSGTGLGLALVKQLAKLHGGTVSISSELGKGSSFTVSLPISQVTIGESADTLKHIERVEGKEVIV